MAVPPLRQAPPDTVTTPTAGEAPGALRALAGMGTCWWSATLVAGAVAFLVIGVPTALVDTPIFGRQVAPHWWDYVLLAASSLLVGMVWATRTPRVDPGDEPDAPGTAPSSEAGERAGRRRSVVGGALTFLAVGCPTCNKLVLVTLGSSGALSWFAPIQPVLGLAAVVLLALTLRRRLRSTGPQTCAA